MTAQTLVIETLGICTHFTHGVASGVPHRVVLPNCTQIQSNTLTLPRQSRVLYYLIPHFPQLEVSGEVELTIPGMLHYGDVLIGTRLQVINCIDQHVVYLDDDTPKLTDFDPDYSFSGDVVLQGRAACYFDIYGGRVSYQKPKTANGAGRVRIEMQTDGPPELLATPLDPWVGPRGPAACRVSLGAAEDPLRPITLIVRNVELIAEKLADEQWGSFDFLLHYLTARGGIPDWIARPTPGMPEAPASVTPERLASALRVLADVVAAAGDLNVRRPIVHDEDLTSSCAPSQYP
jgi:hypothetical protein